MTVKELIEKLQKYDEELTVVVDGYEGGVTKEFEVLHVNIEENVNREWWYGELEINEKIEKKVVSLQRERLTEDREFKNLPN